MVLLCSNSERSTCSYMMWYYTGLSPSVVQYSKSFYSHPMFFRNVWCHCRFLSPILTASRLIFVPVVTKMFQFTTCNHFCGFPRWGLCTFQNVFSDTMFRIVKRPCVHWSQGIHKTPRLSYVAKDGLEPSTAGL